MTSQIYNKKNAPLHLRERRERCNNNHLPPTTKDDCIGATTAMMSNKTRQGKSGFTPFGRALMVACFFLFLRPASVNSQRPFFEFTNASNPSLHWYCVDGKREIYSFCRLFFWLSFCVCRGGVGWRLES